MAYLLRMIPRGTARKYGGLWFPSDEAYLLSLLDCTRLADHVRAHRPSIDSILSEDRQACLLENKLLDEAGLNIETTSHFASLPYFTSLFTNGTGSPTVFLKCNGHGGFQWIDLYFKYSSPFVADSWICAALDRARGKTDNVNS